MPLVQVDIKGADEAVFFWDDQKRTLMNTGPKRWQTAFNASADKHYYRIKVAGQPNDPWSGVVSDTCTTHNNGGNMSPNGRDQTGRKRFDVC